MAPPPAPTVESVIPSAFIWARIWSYWPLVLQPSVSRMMWRRVAVVFSRDCTAWSRPEKMFVWPFASMLAIAPCRSVIPPNGSVLTTQCAEESNATTPSWSCADSAEAARRIASLPMSTFLTPAIPDPPPMPLPKLLQWQAAMDPDLSMTTTSATSGCFCLSRTPMSTGSVASSGVLAKPPAP